MMSDENVASWKKHHAAGSKINIPGRDNGKTVRKMVFNFNGTLCTGTNMSPGTIHGTQCPLRVLFYIAPVISDRVEVAWMTQ
jgi:hypothetical protein